MDNGAYALTVLYRTSHVHPFVLICTLVAETAAQPGFLIIHICTLMTQHQSRILPKGTSTCSALQGLPDKWAISASVICFNQWNTSKYPPSLCGRWSPSKTTVHSYSLLIQFSGDGIFSHNSPRTFISILLSPFLSLGLPIPHLLSPPVSNKAPSFPLILLPLLSPPLVISPPSKGRRELEQQLLPHRNVRSLEAEGGSSIITPSTFRTPFQHSVAVNCPSVPLWVEMDVQTTSHFTACALIFMCIMYVCCTPWILFPQCIYSVRWLHWIYSVSALCALDPLNRKLLPLKTLTIYCYIITR